MVHGTSTVTAKYIGYSGVTICSGSMLEYDILRTSTIYDGRPLCGRATVVRESNLVSGVGEAIL